MNPNDNIKTSGSQIAEPLDAASVILMREKHPAPFEIFLMRRHKDQSFMAGAFVFPGGRLDPEDCHHALAQYSLGFLPNDAREKLHEPNLSDGKALGLFFAAVRETFEEAGVLLAKPNAGGVIDFTDEETYKRFSKHRSMIQKNKISLVKLAQIEGINFTLDKCLPYSHWITPRVESKRFDTRFMLVELPQNQRPVHDSIELIDSLWVTPKKALAQHEAGEILLMPPTLKHVEELSEFSSISRLFSAVSSRNIYPILPQPLRLDKGMGMMLPHDPEYSVPEYKQSPRPGKDSRIVMINGKWRTQRFEK